MVVGKDTLDSGHRLAVLVTHDAGVTIAEDSAALAPCFFAALGDSFALHGGSYFYRPVWPIIFGHGGRSLPGQIEGFKCEMEGAGLVAVANVN